MQYSPLSNLNRNHFIQNTMPDSIGSQFRPSIHLVVQLYKARNPDLSRRMKECIEHNLKLDVITRMTIVAQGVEIKTTHPKIQVVRTSERSTYAQLLKIGLDGNHDSSSHVAISNTDIFLAETLELLARRLSSKSSVAAVTRHELDGALHANPKLSQDLWLFCNHKPGEKFLTASDYELGIAGCEHLFAMALQSHGYDIWNPSIDCIISHNDPNPRTSFSDRYNGAYLYLLPCSIDDVGRAKPQYEISISRRKFQEGPTTPKIPNPAKLHLCCGDKKSQATLE